jgi:hypothetical protein
MKRDELTTEEFLAIDPEAANTYEVLKNTTVEINAAMLAQLLGAVGAHLKQSDWTKYPNTRARLEEIMMTGTIILALALDEAN